MRTTTLLLLATLCASAYSAHWAVIVAGSNGFGNYRHQADVCHAYHTLLDKGIPADHIITFSYNDVASSSSNPFPNTLYNKPTTGPGKDFNAGCVIDYQKGDVTPANYISVLKGDAAAMKGKGTGRVLQSTKDDQVFLNFADHGGPDLIAFPSSYLYSKDFLGAFQYMHDNNMYNKLVYYLEACESGSMFVNMSKDINVYALSASSPSESSWGTYCYPDDQVNGKHVGSCLGDLFSVNWMELTDSIDVSQMDLQTHFTQIKTATDKSQVMQWGDLTWTSDKVGHFIGTLSEERPNGFLQAAFEFVYPIEWGQNKKASVDSRDAQLHYLTTQFILNPNMENMMNLQAELDSMKFFHEKFTTIADLYAPLIKEHNYENKVDFECYENLINHFEANCGKLTDNSLKYLKNFHAMCQAQNFLFQSAMDHITEICQAQQ